MGMAVAFLDWHCCLRAASCPLSLSWQVTPTLPSIFPVSMTSRLMPREVQRVVVAALAAP